MHLRQLALATMTSSHTISSKTAYSLLDDVRGFIARFVAFSSQGELDAVTLWAVHTHLVQVCDSSPRLALLSPEPGSGKTRTLEVLELLVRDPLSSISASAASIFRTLAKAPRTILFDEADSIFGLGRGTDASEELRALINAGHRRGAVVPRCVGPLHDVREFQVYAAVALAGLGDLPDTVMSRSVVVRMRRRLPAQRVEQFRSRDERPVGEALRGRLTGWASAIEDAVLTSRPEMPPGVEDRPADVWEPLLAIADEAGGHWPTSSRSACLEMIRSGVNNRASLGLRLLSDLHNAFGEERVLSTEEILNRLHALEEAPWADLRGRPLDARGLAYRLHKFGAESTKVKFEGRALQGYRREDLWDAFTRYLPGEHLGEAEPTEPTEPDQFEVPDVPQVLPVQDPLRRPKRAWS